MVYVPVILSRVEDFSKSDYIRAWVDPQDYVTPSDLVLAFESLISPDGPFYMSRVVWASKYADCEYPIPRGIEYDDDCEFTKNNLYAIASLSKTNRHLLTTPIVRSSQYYRYAINHTKKLFVDRGILTNDSQANDAIPYLTCEGYIGRGYPFGAWARDIISIDEKSPDGYSEFICDFSLFFAATSPS